MCLFCLGKMVDPLFPLAGQYLNLDKDHNGMLSKEELSRYGTGTLTSVFLDCVYRKCLTYDGEIVKTLSSWGLPLGVFCC